MQILDFGQVDFRYFKGWVRDLNMDVQKIKFIKQTINKPKLITLHFISFVLIVGQILYMVSQYHVLSGFFMIIKKTFPFITAQHSYSLSPFKE